MVKIWLLKVVITTIKAELSSDWWPIINGNDHTRSGKCFSKDAKPTCHMRNEHSAIQQAFWFWEARFGILSSHGPRGCKWNLPSRRRQISCQRASSSASPGVTHSIQDPGWSRFGAPQRLTWNPCGWAISTRDLGSSLIFRRPILGVPSGLSMRPPPSRLGLSSWFPLCKSPFHVYIHIYIQFFSNTPILSPLHPTIFPSNSHCTMLSHSQCPHIIQVTLR